VQRANVTLTGGAIGGGRTVITDDAGADSRNCRRVLGER
jgi:hypothetical protein